MALVCAHGETCMPILAAASGARDGLDYLSAYSGLAGAMLAGIAIVYAAWQNSKTKRDLIRERRLEFELGLLAEIRRQMSVTQFQHLAGYVGALVTNPSDEADLALLRAAIGVKSGPIGRARRDEVAKDARTRGADRQAEWLLAAAAEVDAAIQRRLER